MGREIVYCWKCATRLQSDDFERSKAYRVGDKASCSDCVFELVADLPAEEQEAILKPQTPPRKKSSSTQIKAAATGGGTQRRGGTGPIPKVRTGGTGRIPTVTAGKPPSEKGTRTVSKKITRPIPKVAPPPAEGEEGEAPAEADPADRKKKVVLFSAIGGGALLVLVLVLVFALGGDKGKPAPVTDTGDAELDKKKSKTSAAAKADNPKEQAAKTAFLNAQTLKTQSPNEIALQWKAWKDADEAGRGTSYDGKA
ncbi:MAG TPA: hypothetical protein VEN81_08995, partial [Planctomycetota bacterium]|nr:hypothetical protein [Planctomycetota bacterium]